MKRLNLMYLAGILVLAVGFFASPAPSWAAYGDHLSDITAGGLNQPAKVAVDTANGDVYVSDAGNKMVKRYDKNGVYISGFSVSGTPVGIAVNASNIFVGDSTNNCVWVYNKSGVLADLLGTGGKHKLGGNSNYWKMRMPNTVSVAPTGHIFVADGDSDKYLIYDKNGYFLYSFGVSGSGTSSGTTINMYNPSGITFGLSSVSGNSWTQYFYVGDEGNYRAQKLHYVYDTYLNVMTTKPTFDQSIGGKGDAFGKFLSIADLAYDNNSRLIVLDSLQQVAQQFDSSGITRNAAFNYNSSTGAVMNLLNIPTGEAVDTTNKKLYVANNQAGNVSVFSTTDLALPTIAITAPTNATTPCTANYLVTVSGTAATSSVTLKLYYFNTTTPTVNNLFSTQTLSVSSGNYSGGATLDLVGTNLSNFMWAGTYGVYAEVYDANNTLATATSSGTIGITTVSGKRRYTCSMQAKFGTIPTQDSDGDGISDFDEIEGTYNAAYGYAATDPYNPDSDGDGLDDGVEEGVKPLNQNTMFAMTSTATIHTNPNSNDTDGDGISDAIEVVKGTSPTNTGDGLTSEADILVPYFYDGVDRWESQIGALNSTSGPVYADITYFKLDGSIAASQKAVKFDGNSFKMLSPYMTSGVNEGSVEIRTTVGAALAGYRDMHMVNINGGGTYDTGHAVQLLTSAATHAYIPYMDSAPNSTSFRMQGYINLKNITNSTIVVTGTYSRTQDQTGANLIPYVVTTKDYTLLPHQALHLDPAKEAGAEGEFIIAFDSNTPKSILGSYYQDRYNAANSTLWDYGMEEALYLSPSTVSYCAMFDTEFARNRAWYAVMSPTYNTLTANVNISFNLTTTTGTSNLLGFYTKGLTLTPGSYYTNRPAFDMQTPDATRTPAPTGTIPSKNAGEGSLKVTSDVPIIANLEWFRGNASNPSLNPPVQWDYGFGVSNPSAAASTIYSAYFDDSDQNRYRTWLNIANPSETDTLTLTVYFYDANGNLMPTTDSTYVNNSTWGPFTVAANPNTCTLGPRSLASFRPRNAGLADVYRTGSAKIVATKAGGGSGQIYGYMLFQKGNITVTNPPTFDYAIAFPLSPIAFPPVPVQLRTTSVTSSEADLAWEANPSFNLAGYNVYRSATSGGPYTKINASLVAQPATAYADTTVSTGNTYYYVLRAVDINSNESGNSGEVIAKP